MRGRSSIVSLCHSGWRGSWPSRQQLTRPIARAWPRSGWRFAVAAQADRAPASISRRAGPRRPARRCATQVEAGCSHGELLQMLRRLDASRKSPTASRGWRRTCAAWRGAWARGPRVTTECDDIRLDRRRWVPFWSAFVHMLRNAVDHGIESGDERVALGSQGRDGWRCARGRSTARWSSRSATTVEASTGRGAPQAARAGTRGAHRRRAAAGVGARRRVDQTDGDRDLRARRGRQRLRARVRGAGRPLSLSTAPGQGATFRFRFPR